MADRLAEGIVTWKSVALRLPSVFRLRPVDPVVVATPVDVVPVVVGVVVFRLLCKRNRGAGRGTEAQGARAVFADLHYRDVNDDFRMGLVQILHQFFRQCDLVGRAAHDHCILRK